MFCFDGKRKDFVILTKCLSFLMAILTSYCFQGLTENDRKANITYIQALGNLPKCKKGFRSVKTFSSTEMQTNICSAIDDVDV